MPCHLYVRLFVCEFRGITGKRDAQFVSVMTREVENSHISQKHAMQIEIIWSRNTNPNKLPKPHATTLNVVGFYMLRPFAHPVACCMLLCVVGSCCEKFETGETFSYNNSQHCWAYNVKIVTSAWI